jgi:hypothetical protein
MLRGKKSVIAAVAATGLMAVTACGSSSSSGGGGGGSTGSKSNGTVSLPSLPTTPIDTRTGKAGGTFRLSIVEPTSIDPFNSQESEGILVTKNLFDTLTTVGPDGKIEKQLAASYSSDKSCTNWTFNVKSGQKFSNGETVDAESIKRGMTRTADGKAASDVAYHMANIKGYDELQASKATDFSGVTASGLVLKVALTNPDCEFDLKTAQPVFSPVPVEAGAASNTKYNDEPIGNGPFKMAQPWQHDKSITLVRNDAYTDGPKALLDKVQLTINDGSITNYEYQNFQQGTLDFARLNPEDLEAAAKKYYNSSQDTNQFIKYQSFGINYLLVNVVNGPLNSVKARAEGREHQGHFTGVPAVRRSGHLPAGHLRQLREAGPDQGQGARQGGRASGRHPGQPRFQHRWWTRRLGPGRCRRDRGRARLEGQHQAGSVQGAPQGRVRPQGERSVPRSLECRLPDLVELPRAAAGHPAGGQPGRQPRALQQQAVRRAPRQGSGRA